jgi:hypothetical protein
VVLHAKGGGVLHIYTVAHDCCRLALPNRTRVDSTNGLSLDACRCLCLLCRRCCWRTLTQ